MRFFLNTYVPDEQKGKPEVKTSDEEFSRRIRAIREGDESEFMIRGHRFGHEEASRTKRKRSLLTLIAR